MAIIEAFHNVLFPTDLGFGLSKTIERNIEVQDFISGRERRNGRVYHSKRKYSIGIGAKSFDDLGRIVEFFEARRGALVGFKWHDVLDYKSCDIVSDISMNDQQLGIYDGSNLEFQLVKKYGDLNDDTQNYWRRITKPKSISLLVSVGGVLLGESFYMLDDLTGVLSIDASALNVGDAVKVGFEFDVAVRFEQMQLHIDYKAFDAGDIAQIPIIEILD